jgi:hypothetical protein
MRIVDWQLEKKTIFQSAFRIRQFVIQDAAAKTPGLPPGY